MDYSEQDICDVTWKQTINSTKTKTQAHELGIQPTIEAAIRWHLENLDERITPALMAEESARYERGVTINEQFVLVTSPRTVDVSENAEAFFRTQRNVTGPVIIRAAGYAATNQMYIFQALRPRSPGDQDEDNPNE